MNIFRRTIWLSVLVLCGNMLYGQVLEGRILDEQGEPLVSAVVHLNQQRTISDIEGAFRFEEVETGVYQLEILYLGSRIYSDSLLWRKPFKSLKLDVSTASATAAIDEIEIVDQKQIHTTADETRAAGTLAESLAEVAGVNVLKTGVGIGKPIFRGLTGARLSVYQQGQKQEEHQWGNDHGLSIDGSAVTRMQLHKGAQALRYGSDALGGVLRILPAAIPDTEGIHGTLEGIYKSNNAHYEGRATVQGRYKKLFGRAFVSVQDYADYRVPASSFVYNTFKLPIYEQRLKNTAGHLRNVGLMLGTTQKWGSSRLQVSSYQLDAGLFTGAVGIARTYTLQHDGNWRNRDLPKQEVQHWRINWLTQIQLAENINLRSSIGFQENDRGEYSFPEFHNRPAVDSSNLALGLRLRTWHADFRFEQILTEDWSLEYGLQSQWQQHRRKGFEFLLPDFSRQQLGLYLLSQYKDWTLGLRSDYVSQQTTSFTQLAYNPQGELYTATLSPELAPKEINWAASIGWNVHWEGHHIELRANKSFRVPQPVELSANGIHHGTFRHEQGNPALTAEQGYQFEGNWTWTKTHWSLTAAAYFNYFDNFIYLAPQARFSSLPEAGQLYAYEQHDAIYWGGEITWSAELGENIHLQQALEYVWNRNLEQGTPLPFTPPASVQTQLRYRIPWWKGGQIWLQHQAVAAQNRVARNEKTTKGYMLWNLGLRQRLGTRWTLQLTAKNLTNTAYLNHLSRYRLLELPEQGFNLIATAQWRF